MTANKFCGRFMLWRWRCHPSVDRIVTVWQNFQ